MSDENKAKTNIQSRPVHAAAYGGQIQNPSPDKHYVWASTQNHENNHEYYESIGYEPERFDPKFPLKVWMLKNPKAGEIFTFRGCVLMSCSKERHAEIKRVGPEGSSGRVLFDKFMQKIFNNTIEAPNQRIQGVKEEVDIQAFEKDGFR